METILPGGARVHLTDRGTGTPVLFLHGFPDTCALWDEVIARMAKDHRCLALDLPGFGRSDIPRDFDCSLNALSAWVDAAVLSLNLTHPIDLVMHDFGGLFGLAWAVRHPDQVRRMGVLNTVFFPDYRWHFWARVWRTPLLGELSFALTSRTSLTLEMRRGSRRLPAAHGHLAFESMTPAMKKMALRLYRANYPHKVASWQDGLKALFARVPAIVLWGDRDPYINRVFADKFQATDVHHFANAGHWLPVEEPEAIAKYLLEFFH